MNPDRDEYRDIARVYDPLLAPLLNRVWRSVARLLASGERAEGPGPVLDLGCGTGRQALLLARSGLNVLGLDRSPAMLARARKNMNRENLARETAKRPELRLSFLLADASCLPLPDAVLGGASVTLALHEMEPGASLAVLREVARTLRPDGVLAVLDYCLADACPRTILGRLAGPLVHGVERLAGKRHHRAYREYLANGGLPGLAGRAGLDCSLEERFFWNRMGLYRCTHATG